MNTPRIYVACLSTYNAGGRYHGVWVDCDGTEDVPERIAAMLAASPMPDAEEWEIHDSENWLGVDPSMFPIERLSELGEALMEHGTGLGIFVADVLGSAYAGKMGVSDIVSEYENKRLGVHDSYEDYAEEYLSDCGHNLPDVVVAHIDYDSLGRDLLCDCNVIEAEGCLYVFAY